MNLCLIHDRADSLMITNHRLPFAESTARQFHINIAGKQDNVVIFTLYLNYYLLWH